MIRATARESKLARAITIAREEGPRVLFAKVVAEIGCHRRLLRLERDLSEPIVDHQPRVPVVIDLLRPDELDPYLALRTDATASDLAARLAAGAICFVARQGGRAVAVCWTSTRDTRNVFFDCPVRVRPGEAYFFDAFTDPASRGLGIAPAICARQLHHCRDAGLARAFRLTAPYNASAVRAHGKSGFRPVGVIGRVALGSWRHYYTRIG